MAAANRVTAREMRETSTQHRLVMRDVKIILSHIYDKIKEARDVGNKKPIIVRVPFHFSIAGMTNKDAQRRIYYTILQTLLQDEYKVYLRIGAGITEFEISWISEEDAQQIEYEMAILARHTKKITEEE